MTEHDNPLVRDEVMLRPVTPSDYERLHVAELSGEQSILYRHRGVTPSPEAFVASLWQGVLAQYMVCRTEDGEPMGIVACYGADLRNGHAHLAAFTFPDFRRSRAAQQGVEMFIDYLWRAFPLRKLYAEVLAPNLTQFGSTVDVLWMEEGRLRGHEYVEGQYVDKLWLALYREAWDQRSRQGSVLADRIRELAQGAGAGQEKVAARA